MSVEHAESIDLDGTHITYISLQTRRVGIQSFLKNFTMLQRATETLFKPLVYTFNDAKHLNVTNKI